MVAQNSDNATSNSSAVLYTHRKQRYQLTTDFQTDNYLILAKVSMKNIN